MDIPTYFTDFMHNIRPSPQEMEVYQRAHRELRELLLADDDLKDLVVITFLQGSYRRATLLRPGPGEHADVDVVVVTRMSGDDTTPDQAIRAFVPFLDRHYPGKYRLQGRSIGITLDGVDLDLVVTSAPSESQQGILQSDGLTDFDTVENWQQLPSWFPPSLGSGERSGFQLRVAQDETWRLEPLEIPDREARRWEPTHPLEQIRWTHEKNRRTNGHFIHVVRAIKEWKRLNKRLPRYPKGYPLEHLIGACCPDGITSTAEGVTLTLEAMDKTFAAHAAAGVTPELPDHGVPEHNVLQRVSGSDFAAFHSQVGLAAKTVRAALNASSVEESANLWGQVFGNDFPKPPGGGGSDKGSGDPTPDQSGGGFAERQQATVVGGGRFA